MIHRATRKGLMMHTITLTDEQYERLRGLLERVRDEAAFDGLPDVAKDVDAVLADIETQEQ